MNFASDIAYLGCKVVLFVAKILYKMIFMALLLLINVVM